MVDWDALELAGVPLGAVRALGGRVEPGRVLLAVAAAAREPLGETERVALRAWLSGLAHHWPERFDQLAGDEGRALLQRLSSEDVDANRYLKLRRIAIEHLAASTLKAPVEAE